MLVNFKYCLESKRTAIKMHGKDVMLREKIFYNYK